MSLAGLACPSYSFQGLAAFVIKKQTYAISIKKIKIQMENVVTWQKDITTIILSRIIFNRVSRVLNDICKKHLL
jgi:hypothetical protein